MHTITFMYVYRVVCVYSYVLNSIYTRIRGIYNLCLFYVYIEVSISTIFQEPRQINWKA